MKPRAGSKALIREINEALILDILRTQAPVSRATVATQTGLSAASVTGITAKLIRGGLVVETETLRDTGGRPARLLELGLDGVFAAGVRLSPAEALAVIVDLRGGVVATHREPLASSDPRDAAEAVAHAVRQAAGGKMSQLIGVGVTLSGVVDRASGVVRHSGALGWADVPFREQLEDVLGESVVLDSYANAYARGLLFEGSFATRELLVFSVGMSLGASVVVEGRIQPGFNGAAGGFAHSRAIAGAVPVRMCHCGAEDCLETRGSLWGMLQEIERGGEAARAIDPELDREIITSAAWYLGVGMANVAKVLGPEKVVVGFAPEAQLGTFAEQTRESFLRQFEHSNTPAPELDTTVTDHVALARGAACSVLGGLFTARESQEQGN